MKRIFSIVVFIVACSPDLGAITATQEEIEDWLPAKADEQEECARCVEKHCSMERIACQNDEECNDFLYCRAGANNPFELFACDDLFPKDEQSYKKYKSYYNCAFHGEGECGGKCEGGKNWNCTIMGGGQKTDTDVNKPNPIKLSIRILQIDDLISEMISPGEHGVCVQWMKDENEEYKCKDSTSTNTIDGCDSECTEECTVNYTNGFGKADLCVDSTDKDAYLRITRGAKDELTYDDLGPFHYYLERRHLDRDHNITIHLPSKALESKWKCEWEKYGMNNDKGTIIAIAYDCIGTPVRGASFSLSYVEDSEGSYTSAPIYWDYTTELEIVFNNDPESSSTSLLGMVTLPNVEKREVNIDVLYGGETMATRDLRIKEIEGTTTFVALYPP